MLSLQFTKTNYRSVDFSILLLRLGFGILMIPHGYAKLMAYAEKKNDFMQFMGLSGPISLSLTIFSELVCSVLLVLGLFTRLAVFPLIITALVIVFVAHEGDIFGHASSGFFYLLAYIVIFFVGPGKYSIDHRISKV